MTAAGESGIQAALVSVWLDIGRRPSGRRVEAFCADDEQVTPVGAELDAEARDIDGGSGGPDAEFIEAVRSCRPATPDDNDLPAHST